MLLEGLHIPLTTPFHPDGRLNLHKIASNIARYSKTPAAGLIVLGTSGEPTLLSDDETREVLRTAAQSAAPEKVLIAGISRDSVRATLTLADFATELDYDAALVGIPSVLAAASDRRHPVAHRRELLTFLQTIADRSPVPIVLLSVHGRAIPIEAVVTLAAHPNILAILDAQSHDLNSEPNSGFIRQLIERTAAIRRDATVTSVFTVVTARMEKASGDTTPTLVSAASLTGAATAIAEPPPTRLRTRSKTIGFQILAGNTSTILENLHAGAVGIALAFAACAPQACYEVFAAWKDQDLALAEEKQSRLREAARLADEILGPGGLKFACDLNGYFGGLPRLPHLPLTGEQRGALEQLMKEVRN